MLMLGITASTCWAPSREKGRDIKLDISLPRFPTNGMNVRPKPASGTMVRGGPALLFFVHAPAVIGASIPSWMSQSGGVSPGGDARGNTSTHTPMWPPPIGAFFHSNGSIEQKAYVCNEMCGADGADCPEHFCSEVVGAGVAYDSSSNMTSVDESTDVFCNTYSTG